MRPEPTVAYPLRTAARIGLIGPMPLKRRSNYEQIQFVAARGTRDFYREAAELEGLELKEWMRATLHAHATRTLAQHGVELEAPPVHTLPPPPLQQR